MINHHPSELTPLRNLTQTCKNVALFPIAQETAGTPPPAARSPAALALERIIISRWREPASMLQPATVAAHVPRLASKGAALRYAKTIAPSAL